MIFKRLVLTILLLIALVPFVYAQQSAQATMKVQVTVVEGNSMTTSEQNLINLSNQGGSNEFSSLNTLSINRKAHSTFVLNRPESLVLRDKEGKVLDLPVHYIDRAGKNGLTSEMNAASIDANNSQIGDCEGTVTTSIAYL